MTGCSAEIMLVPRVATNIKLCHHKLIACTLHITICNSINQVPIICRDSASSIVLKCIKVVTPVFKLRGTIVHHTNFQLSQAQIFTRLMNML